MITAASRLKYHFLSDLKVLTVVLVSAFSLPSHPQAVDGGNAASGSQNVEHDQGLRPANAELKVAAHDGLKIRTKPLRFDVDLVLVPVIVTDPLNHPVTQLGKERFELIDNGKDQPIQVFSAEDAPLSIALVLDVSNSMVNRVEVEREALAQFFANANPLDEYYAIAVSDDPIVVAESTHDIVGIQNKFAALQPAGYTALLDSISIALNKLQSARYARRAILIISDGGENASRFSYREVKALARESDVLIYAIRPIESVPLFRTIEEKMGGHLLSGIAEATGGRSVPVGSNDRLPAAAAEISSELRSQYILGFRPSPVPGGGTAHKIKVRIVKPEEKLHAHYKSQYSVASQ